MSKEFYCQCELRKRCDTGELIDIAWIPEKFAKVNKLVNIKLDDGKLDGPWKIIKVYSKVESEKIEGSERDYLKQREVSDI